MTQVRKRPYWKTAGLSALLVVSWAGAFVIQKWGLQTGKPLWLALGRAAFAALPFLCIPSVIKAIVSSSWSTHRLGLALATTNVALFFPLQLVGLEELKAGIGAALVYLQPVLSTVAAHWLYNEQLSRRRAIGVACALAGVIVIGFREAAIGALAGVLIMVAAAFAWSAGSLLVKVASSRDLLPILGMQNLYGFVLLLPIVPVVEELPALDTRYFVTIIYSGIVASALGWLVLAILLRDHEVGVVSSIIFLVPAVAAVLGIVVLNERFTWYLLSGLGLVILGLKLVTSTGRPDSSPGL